MVDNWLVTGGCGFIGTALIRYLIDNHLARHIRILDNLSVGTREDLATSCEFTESSPSSLVTPLSLLQVELVNGDIRDPEICEKCCKNMDIIVHLAANTGVPKSVENPRLDMECNVIGTFNMLEAARVHQVKRFVFASSGAPAGEVAPPIHEELPPHPVSPYGASKLAGEGYCSAYFRTFGIETVALRFSNVYGPGSSHKSSVVAKFIKQALAGETLEIYGDGTQTRDFIYIDDLVNALVLAATKEGIGGETFQIATSRETTLDEITELLLKVLEENGIERPKVKKTTPRQGDVKRNFSDTTKAREILGWESKKRLVEGITMAIQWFISEKERRGPGRQDRSAA
ncbi:NAD-dependent epimerase/dehydratase family protein [Thermodesulfobacteriota bacterium B35]